MTSRLCLSQDTQRINQVARERNEVAIYEELYARRHGNRADNIVI